MNDWLTLREAADYIKIRPRTLALWARQGNAPAHKLSGISHCVWRFLRAELDGMLNAHPVLRKDKMKRAPRFKIGSVVFDRRRRIWNFLTWERGKRRTRRIGTLSEYPSKSAAQRAAQTMQLARVPDIPQPQPEAATIRLLVEQYRAERMPARHDMREGYESWLRVYIFLKWEDCAITDLQARPVEIWLDSLSLAPKSKVHIRGILSALWNYAMWKARRPNAGQPHQFGYRERCIQADPSTANSHG